MQNKNILLPNTPRVVEEAGNKGVYEIENLYPGYGHTLGNSLRRIIHSSILGCAITSVKIDGVLHEFSTIDGVVEDVITLILHLKRVNFKMVGDSAQTVTLSVKGERKVYAKDLVCTSEVEVVNGDEYICELSSKSAKLDIEIVVEKGIGYRSKTAVTNQEKTPIGTIVLDADFTPIRRVKYEVEDMRVGDRTDYNRLVLFIETDGSLTPKEAFLSSVETMIKQLEVLVSIAPKKEETKKEVAMPQTDAGEADEDEVKKTKIEDLNLSARTTNALMMAGIKSVAGIVRKTEADLHEVEGLGEKAVEEIKESIAKLGLELKQ
jgi:DNA-directed RNA polymerase subunit alpha